MSAAHTKGPWSLFPIETGWIVNQAGAAGYICTLPSMSHRAAECAANAHLIVAAPELLEALSEYDDAFAEFDTANKASRHRMRMAVIKARAAIAKATGSAA